MPSVASTARPRTSDDSSQLKVLQADYFILRNHCDKVQLKATEQAKELKEARKMNEAYEKNVISLRRKYEQTLLDKREVEEQALTNREYAKRVEQKLLMGSKGQYLSDKNNELRERTRALKEVVQEKSEIISSQVHAA